MHWSHRIRERRHFGLLLDVLLVIGKLKRLYLMAATFFTALRKARMSCTAFVNDVHGTEINYH